MTEMDKEQQSTFYTMESSSAFINAESSKETKSDNNKENSL